MTIRSRLKRLTDLARRKGYDLDNRSCPVCRKRWGLTVLATSRKATDGRIVPGEGHPMPCSACGRVPEQVIELILTTVGRSPETGEIVEIPWQPEES
jgi:hypothetical protein